MIGFAAGSPSRSARGGCRPRAGGQTCHSAAQGPAPAPGPGPAPAPHLSGRLESGHTRNRSSDGSSGCAKLEPWPWPCPPPPLAALRSTAVPPRSMAAPAPVRSPARPGLRRGARTVVPPAFPPAGAGATPPGAMGVLVPAGVVRGRARSGRRWAGPGALQRGRQDPLPARHWAVPPPPLRPAVVPQPGKGAARPGEVGSLRPGKGSNGLFPVCLLLSRPGAASTPSSRSGRCAEWRCTTGTRCLSPSPGLSTRSCWAWSPTSATWRSCCQPQAGTSQAGPRCCWEAMAEAGLLA